MNRRGAVFVVFLFAASAFFFFFLGAFEWARAVLQRERAQTISDTAVLSSLRIRCKSLQTIASRWNDIGREVISANTAGALVPRGRWSTLSGAAEDLAGSLSGYQGRLSAVITVLAGAYGISRDDVDVSTLRLGVLAQPLAIRDENGDERIVPAGWYKRQWEELEFETVDLQFGGASARGRLVGEASEGNGGFPSTWENARVGNRLEPHRYPFYRAELVGNE